MSKATLVYLKERPVNSESQGSQSNPRSHNSIRVVTAEQKRTDPIPRHPSMQTPSLSTDPDAGYHKYCSPPTEDRRRGETVGSHSDVTMPSWRVSPRPNANSSIRGQALNGSAGAPRPGVHTRSHSPAPDHPVRNEGGSDIPVVNSSNEHDVGITGNEVTVPRTLQHFRIRNQLTTGSYHRTAMVIFGATFAHIYCTSRISQSLLRSSTDALQEVGLLPLCRYAKSS
jgi:hypothetical protein